MVMPGKPPTIGGPIKKRELHFIWIVDCSGSMKGDRIASLNNAAKNALYDLKAKAGSEVGTNLLISVLCYSSGAEWKTTKPVPVEDFNWTSLVAEGFTSFGAACRLLQKRLTVGDNGMPQRAISPVLVLLSDGSPTDEYEQDLNTLLELPWGKKSVKMAIAIGDNPDMDMLHKFTQDDKMIFSAGRSSELAKHLRFASTLAVSVSMGAKNSTDDDTIFNLLDIDEPEPIDGDCVF